MPGPMRKDVFSTQFIALIASYTHVIVTPLLHSGSDRREKEPDMKLLDFEVELGERTQVGGLTVIPLIGVEFQAPAYLTGPEAFEAGLLEVDELDPPEVPKLAITNLSDLPVLLVEGEMLVGGDQNRTMNVTVLCPPRARTVVPVSCVEAGRWGARRTMSGRRKHAPGSLRAAKTSNLESRSDDVGARGTDQGLVWDEVSRQSTAHAVYSSTAALDDVQEEVEERISQQLECIEPQPNQVGVVCTIGDVVVGLDIFDRPSAMGQYLRAIVAGHALDDMAESRSGDPIAAIERFLARVDASRPDTGKGVGLGNEVLLRGKLAGVGLSYGDHLVHLAAFPAPDDAGAACDHREQLRCRRPFETRIYFRSTSVCRPVICLRRSLSNPVLVVQRSSARFATPSMSDSIKTRVTP